MAYTTLNKMVTVFINNLNSAVCRKRIRGERWHGLGGVSSVKQFRLQHTGKSTVNSLQDLQLNE